MNQKEIKEAKKDFLIIRNATLELQNREKELWNMFSGRCKYQSLEYLEFNDNDDNAEFWLCENPKIKEGIDYSSFRSNNKGEVYLCKLKRCPLIDILGLYKAFKR